MLEVVEEEQDPLAFEEGGERLERAFARLLAHRQRLADRGKDERSIAQRGEKAGKDARRVVGEAILARASGELECEAGLSLAAGAVDGEQARSLQKEVCLI